VPSVVGIVSSGAMGSALGARLREGGSRVVVALEGRSERTRRLAAVAGLDAAGSLERGSGGARPLVVELNAISPTTTRRIAATLGSVGVDTVDGSISGPPPLGPGTTRIYLSGPRASEVAALPFEGVERVVVSDVVGDASAVKMCTASVYKGRIAVLAQAFRTARAHGVVDHVLADLVAAGLVDAARTGTTLGIASAKAWRYVAEMEEIAETQAAAGLTPDLFRSMAAVYADLAERAVAETPEDVPDGLSLADVLARFGGEGPGPADAI
jgi:3-hydroxyisobutyrate dehydrogenase-like beta-hydroxyacid dehydrogenase